MCCSRVRLEDIKPNASTCHWTYRVHVSPYVEPGEAGFISKQLMSQEAVVEDTKIL